jgi:hypothetical protein
MGSRDHDLPVDHATFRQLLEQRLVQVREIAVERAQIPTLNEELRRAAKDDGAKAVPLRLEEKGTGLGEGIRQLGEHRLDRRVDRKRFGAKWRAHTSRRMIRIMEIMQPKRGPHQRLSTPPARV